MARKKYLPLTFQGFNEHSMARNVCKMTTTKTQLIMIMTIVGICSPFFEIPIQKRENNLCKIHAYAYKFRKVEISITIPVNEAKKREAFTRMPFRTLRKKDSK